MLYYKFNFAIRILLILVILAFAAPAVAWGQMALSQLPATTEAVVSAAPVIQDLPVSLPSTATDAVSLFLAFIAAVATVATFTNLFADAIKKVDNLFLHKVGKELLTDEQERSLSGWLAEITVLLVAVLVGFATTEWLTPLATYLDSIGAWPVIGTGYALARNVIYLWRKQAGASL